jgi:hypothetical protein
MALYAVILAYELGLYQELNRTYLIGCEYLQIDPSKAYDIAFVEKRVEHVLSQWGSSDDQNDLKKLREILDKFLRIMRTGQNGQVPVSLNYLTLGFRPGTGAHAFQTNAFWGGSAPPAPAAATAQEMFAKRIAKLIKENKLTIQPGTVNEEYVKKELRQDNYDDYQSRMPKWPK